MSTVIALLPTLVAVALFGSLLVSSVQVARRHLHPARLALHGLGAATALGIVGLAGIVPASLWWATWLVAVAVLVGMAICARRLLRTDPPAHPTPRQTELLAPPSRFSVSAEALLCAGLVVLALAAG